MAIGVRTPNSPVFGTNSLSPIIAAAQVTGDMMILIAGGKPYDLDWEVTTSGWTLLSAGTSGTTAAGVDTGSMKMGIWYKEAVSDTEGTPTVTELTPAFNVAGAVVQIFSKGAGEVWDIPVAVYGADEVSGTAISVTFDSDPGVTTGDLVITACAINTDAMGPLTGDLVPTQTGVTFGSTTQRTEGETISGGDMALHVSTTPVNSGTGTAVPLATGTGTASGGADRLEAAFIRLRVSTPSGGTTHPGWLSSRGGWFG